MNIIEVTLKLLMALALGGLIGMERETSQKPAGFRTNILFCVGAAMMMILAGLLFNESGGNGSEVARIAARTHHLYLKIKTTGSPKRKNRHASLHLWPLPISKQFFCFPQKEFISIVLNASEPSSR